MASPKGPTLKSIVVAPSAPAIPIGGTQRFTATGTYANGSQADISSLVTWASSDTTVATVDATGLAAGVANGQSIISASFGNVSGEAQISVGQGGPEAPLNTVAALKDITVGDFRVLRLV